MSGKKDPFAKPPEWFIEIAYQREIQRQIEEAQTSKLYSGHSLQDAEKIWRLQSALAHSVQRQKDIEKTQTAPAKPTIARRDPAREAIILAIDILRNELGREPHRSEVYAFLADCKDPEGDITHSDPHIGLSWVNSKGKPKLMTKKQFNARYKMLAKDD